MWPSTMILTSLPSLVAPGDLGLAHTRARGVAGMLHSFPPPWGEACVEAVEEEGEKVVEVGVVVGGAGEVVVAAEVGGGAGGGHQEGKCLV